MEDDARRYLHYIRASLADGERLAPHPDEGVEVDAGWLMSGKVGAAATTSLFNRAREQKPHGVEEEQLWPLKVLVCPYVYNLRPDHARSSTRLPRRIVPLVLSAKLHKDGTLDPDENCTLPLIPRDYLEPSSCDVVLGTIEDADRAYAALERVGQGWSALRARGQELITKVTGQDADTLILEQYEKYEYGLCLLQKTGSALVHIEKLLDVMLKQTERSYPLLEALLAVSPDLPVKSARECLTASTRHVGQMECRYALAPSQRQALLHHLARPDEAPYVLAVDGPPGTGKTTLLLSAIATMWTQRALDEAEAPLVVATSTNNQAVDNILEAFGKVQEPDDPLSGRWLPGIHSYGQSLPAKARADAVRTRDFHAFFEAGGGFQHAGQAFESQEGLRQARAEYLEHFRKAFPASEATEIESCRSVLHTRLKEFLQSVRSTIDALLTVAEFVELPAISQATCEARTAQFEGQSRGLAAELVSAQERLRKGRGLHKDWKEHLSTEPFWRTLLAAVGLQSPRVRRDELFYARATLDYEAVIGDRLRSPTGRPDVDRLIGELLDELSAKARAAAEASQELQRQAESFARARVVLSPWYGEKCDGSVEAIQAALDVGPRFKAFKLATHYWEARYLLEVEAQLGHESSMKDNKNPVKLERLYRRLAKLFPCSVATAYMLPGRFMGYLGEDKPLFDAVDLLIVDEAGQITPEVGVLPFALAKRALVVGDVDQLRPIWKIPAPLDGLNALHVGVITCDEDRIPFTESARAVSGSSLMRIAQRATPFTQHPKRGRGMFLREHRRCWPEIIGICNELVYGGLLISKRDDDGRRKIVPSLGYVHIPGTDQYRGKSRYNLAEAAAIAKWLAQRRGEIEAAFRDERKPLRQLVAVVTPFVAQAQAIRTALRSELGGDFGITVGTVDALQGAEYRVVIFSPTYGVATQPGLTRFDRNPSFLNVAISRAQDAFLIFGNMHLFKPQGSHPSAEVGRFLFRGGENELKDVPVDLLVPGHDRPAGRLIRDLDGHRQVLQEALASARFRLVIVSPFMTSGALAADGVVGRIQRATQKGVSVKIVSDSLFNRNKVQFEECKSSLVKAGAEVHAADGPSVHSKLILVDHSWLVVGSFNWLSSPRDPRNPYVRYESSIRYDGNEAFEMIRGSLKDLHALVPRREQR